MLVAARTGTQNKNERIAWRRGRKISARRVVLLSLSPMLSISRLQTLLPGDLPHKKRHIHPLALITFSP
jgi:hypothetical protein